MFVVKVYYIISWLWVSVRYWYSSIRRLWIETLLITNGTSYGSIGNLRCLWSVNSANSQVVLSSVSCSYYRLWSRTSLIQKCWWILTNVMNVNFTKGDPVCKFIAEPTNKQHSFCWSSVRLVLSFGTLELSSNYPLPDVSGLVSFFLIRWYPFHDHCHLIDNRSISLLLLSFIFARYFIDVSDLLWPS